MGQRRENTFADMQLTIQDLQRQLADRIAERDEALARETATAEVLGVINSSPGDLAPVFDAMLDKALELCSAPFGILWTYDGDAFRAAALRRVPDAFAESLVQRLARPAPGSGTSLGQILTGSDAFQILDAAADPAYRDNPAARPTVQQGGARTIASVPLRKEGTLLGVITIYRQEVRPFSDKQIALLQNFAAQAVIAMENARLITETREALEQQTATAEVLQIINSSPGDLAPVFDAMLEKALRFCDAAHGALYGYDGSLANLLAVRGGQRYVSWVRQRGGPFEPGEGTLSAALRGQAIVHVDDIQANKEFRLPQPLLDAGNIRTNLVVALRKEEEVLGAIAVYRTEVWPFTDKQTALLQNFAAQAVIAMENARLITETREALEQQTATAEVLGVINSSPGELAPVFDAILEKAMQLCGAAFGELHTYDGDCFFPAAMRGVPPAHAEFRMQNPIRPVPGMPTINSRIRDGLDVIHVADLKAEEAYKVGHPQRRAIVDLGGARTALGVALRQDRVLLGVIMIYRQEVRPFSDKQIALLQNFAAQAVIAMENARLLGELRQRTEEVAELNRGLEARVAEQVEELGRVGRLKRFLAPQLAELIVSQGDEKILESHRREIVVVFCDLRGYTAFTETAEPEEVLDFLREYHGVLGPLVSQFEGTLDQFSGDGIMVFFNDPVPIPDPAERAVNMTVTMREAAGSLIAAWRERGRDLGFGAGIAQGYATLGQIGFSERSGYTAIGTVCNVAARLCAEAKDGQILLSQRVNAAIKGSVSTEQVGPLALKGLTQPVMAYNVPLAASQAAFRVIEGGPQPA